jgi:hypothetical protein
VRLFLDLDGVLADFDRGVHAVTGQRPEALPLRAMWAALSRAPRFFETLELMQDAEALWQFCAPHHPTILTGLPLGSWAPAQKRRWVARVLGTHVPVITCMSREKPRWSAPGHVLVDDRATAREGWERKDGRFVHHVTAERSIAALRWLGFAADVPPAPRIPSKREALACRGTSRRAAMAGKQDEGILPEMPAVEKAIEKGGVPPQQPSGSSGGHGIASGHNPGGRLPGGAPTPDPGSLGAGNAETGGSATGSQKRGGP